MELLTIQHLQSAQPTHIITACEDTDACPSCGAGYKVGLSACEYCRVPVSIETRVSIPAEVEGYYQRLYDEAEMAA